MKRFICLAIGLVSVAASAAVSSSHEAAPAGNLSAAQIVDRNVAARGGLDSWRAVKTLAMSGKLDAGGKKNAELPFVMKMKRPHMSRLEIRFEDQTAVQVYDGAQGWKLRPFLGRDEVEPYTPAEARMAAAWEELDGPLVDYARKGTKVELLGTEAVEAHSAYKLKLTLKNGEQRNLWIDAANFLELKIDGEPRKLDGRVHNVAIYYRDYRVENGLTVPHVLETVVEGVKQSYKMNIERVTVNQPLEDSLFAKPLPALAKVSGQ
jgi:outer membrane lipoprotein-sorting protein